MEKLEKLPESFAIKRDADNPLWQKYIDWLNKTYDNRFAGVNDIYYGFNGIEGVGVNNLEYCAKYPTILTLEQWDAIVNPFVLPKKWYIKGSQELHEWSLAELENKQNVRFDYSIDYFFEPDISFLKWRFCTDNTLLQEEGYTEITFDQFKEHVLSKYETIDYVECVKSTDGSFTLGKIYSHPEHLNLKSIEDYCQKLIAEFKKDPKWELQQEFGRMLMRHIDSFTQEERNRYEELKQLLRAE